MTKGTQIMAAIQRHLVVVANKNSVEYVYWQDRRFRVVSRPAKGKIEISLDWSQQKEKTKIVDEDETTTSDPEVRFERVGFRFSRPRFNRARA